MYNEDFARVNIFGVDTAGNIPSAYEACRRGLDEEVAEKQEQARQAEAEREARRRAEEERRRRAAEEARRQREEAERREQQQATRTTDRCAHVYVGKYFRLRTSGLAAIFGTGYAEYEVLGFSSSTGRVTARNLSSGNTFEIHCGDIP
ncbi:MAG: hypothetical protein KDA17_00350 [Candidatus Saccharibacteria bacterium]|nr:hypothetical protein [Candidatus Saccharibacteria bacterium]